MEKSFYIKERHNPQFKKPYYVALGQITKAEAKRAKKSIYGENFIHEYETEESYKKAIEDLKKRNFNVSGS